MGADAVPEDGGRRQLTIRLLREDAAKLAAIAQQRGIPQTAIIEELIRGLPDPAPPQKGACKPLPEDAAPPD